MDSLSCSSAALGTPRPTPGPRRIERKCVTSMSGVWVHSVGTWWIEDIQIFASDGLLSTCRAHGGLQGNLIFSCSQQYAHSQVSPRISVVARDVRVLTAWTTSCFLATAPQLTSLKACASAKKRESILNGFWSFGSPHGPRGDRHIF